MYSVLDFGVMIKDTGRMEAYAQALQKVVEPGSVVVDIGTGTGIAAMLACKYGAERVYAIEPNPAIQVAREIAKANGYSDKIIFFQEESTKISLPDKADVIVSDMREVLPLNGKHVPSIIDARNRFLKPGGAQIPLKDTISIAGLEAADLHQKLLTPWSENPYDLNMIAGKKFVTNTWGKGRAKPEQILLKPQPLITLDYTTIQQSDINQGISWVAERRGTLHGYQIWFDALLAEGVSFSTGPFTPELIYGTLFFPLSEALEVEKGDALEVKIEAKLLEDDYAWQWNTSVERKGKLVANYKQSSLAAVPMSLENLRKRSNKYVPKLNEDGEVARFVLELMSQKIVLGDIATQLMEVYPKRFTTWEKALTYAGKLSEKFT